jgi:hypothetical protein
VIDLDSYEFRVCMCPQFVTKATPSPPHRIVLGLPAVSLRGRSRHRVRQSPTVVYPTISTSSEERRHYMACRYYRLRQRDLVARDLARVSPRRSPRLKKLLQ